MQQASPSSTRRPSSTCWSRKSNPYSTIATRARLTEGSYITAQIPEKLQTVWDWSEWVYNPNNGQIVNQANATQLIPYNYVVFGVSRYEEK